MPFLSTKKREREGYVWHFGWRGGEIDLNRNTVRYVGGAVIVLKKLIQKFKWNSEIIEEK